MTYYIKRASFLFLLLGVLIQNGFCEPFYSQCGQDKYIYEQFFRGKKNGVFVDIGAHDGMYFSNTYFFEKSLGWRGICVEPIPEVFDKLKTCRNSICVKGCICSKYDEVSFLRIVGHPPTLEMLSGILENYDPRHLARIQSAITLGGGSYSIIKVKCYDLNNLLLANGIHYVDYLSLDTEGGELDILKSIDFTKITIDVISVENNYNISDFRELLEPLGYLKVADLEQDEIYKLNTK